MQIYIRKRAVKIGNYILQNSCTVRKAAEVFGISKSTVHKDVAERLLKIDPSLAENVKVVLDKNKAERHIRGGEATKQKYSNITSPKDTN